MAIAATTGSYLEARGISFDVVPHPHSYSTRETALAAHVSPDHIAKAVILKDGQGPVMVVVPGSHWIRLGAVQQELGRELQLASEEDVAGLFPDCEPGSVPPLGQAYGVECVLDEALTSLANLYFELGDHEELAHLPGDVFLELMKGIRRGNFSHPA